MTRLDKFILAVILSLLAGFLAGFLAFGAAAKPADVPIRTYRILFSPGGEVDEFIAKFNKMRRQNTLVIVDGQCVSACTLAAGLINPDRICATPYAQLVFHSAWVEGPMGTKLFAKDYTEIIYHRYPPKLRDLLREKGWDGGEHTDLIFIEGDELLTVVRPCTAADLKHK